MRQPNPKHIQKGDNGQFRPVTGAVDTETRARKLEKRRRRRMRWKSGAQEFRWTRKVYARVEDLAAIGLRWHEIAACLGITWQQIEERKLYEKGQVGPNHSQLIEAFRCGRATLRRDLYNSLVAKARAGQTAAILALLHDIIGIKPEDSQDLDAPKDDIAATKRVEVDKLSSVQVESAAKDILKSLGLTQPIENVEQCDKH